MPQLTAQENELLNLLDGKSVKVLGKARMKETAMLIYRLLHVADEAAREHEVTKMQLRESRHETSALAVAAFGFVSRESIKNKKTLSDSLRGRCLSLRENYDYAKAYREQNGLDPLIDYTPPLLPMRPPNNFLLVEVGPRFTSTAVPGQQRILLPKGSDDWVALTAELVAGTSANIETADLIEQVPVRQGRVLAVPAQLTSEMALCAGPWVKLVDRMKPARTTSGQLARNRDNSPRMVGDGYAEAPVMRTCADITAFVEVGDRIHFDHTCLTDQNELELGVYLVPYSAVICVTDRLGDPWRGERPYCEPIAGYVLLTRLLPATAQITGDKVERYHNDMLIEQQVAPLPNEGVVAHVSRPLRGTTDFLYRDDRVVFHGYRAHADKSQPLDTGQAFVETIAGTEYLCVRQDYIMAVRTPVSAAA